MYASVETKNPRYSMPHLSFTHTFLPVSWARKGFGLIGAELISRRRPFRVLSFARASSAASSSASQSDVRAQFFDWSNLVETSTVCVCASFSSHEPSKRSWRTKTTHELRH